MAPSLEKAKQTLFEGGATFTLVNGEKEYSSELMGIAPALSLLKNSPELLRGASVADKIVGKAVALLLIYGGVKEIYAGVVSTHALPVLESAGVTIEFAKKVPFIVNRSGTGMCPMEQRMLEVSDPGESYAMFAR